MSRVYDNWERLVGAVLKREVLRRIALCESLSSSINSADSSSRFSFDSFLGDVLDGSSSQSNFFYREAQPIAFEEIKKAIRKYRPVNQGGVGIVWKGWIDEHTLTASTPGFGVAVAVTWDHGGLQEHQKWLKKIKYLAQFHHPNLVKLIGYCLEQDNMISVHEFMPKGSLDSFPRQYQPLPWATIIKVAIGAARGLSFLHDLEVPFIHQDFNITNILLDGEFNAKLSNFSCATKHPTGGMTQVPTRVIGTYGYVAPEYMAYQTRVMGTYGCVAPEYMATGHLTTMCNVYSFGVVLLELLFEREVLNTNRQQNLVEWANTYLDDKTKLSRILDTRSYAEYPHDGANKVVKLASQCLGLDPNLRPRMAEVVLALEQL